MSRRADAESSQPAVPSAEEDYVFGIHSVAALLEKHPERIARLWLQTTPVSARLARLFSAAREAGVRVDSVERSWLSQRSRRALGREVQHQGVLALCIARGLADEKALRSVVASALAEMPSTVLILVLDGVLDARNLGACLRSAEAAGVTAIVLPKRHSAPLNALARRTAAGAAESLFIAGVTNISRTLNDLRDLGVWVYGAADDAAQSYTSLDLLGPSALIVGGEEKGLRRLVRAQCDQLVQIPMHGDVSSLNVSVATGILLFEAVRQRSVV